MKTAVVLFSLGGPDSPDAVEPFLFNLFNDRAIIGLPQPFRYGLARFIAWRRAKIAGKVYDEIGGASPLVANTQRQADALENVLSQRIGDTRCFLAMRYWHPRAIEAAERVRAFRPDRIVLLPLYPQFSTTTSASSLAEWRRVAKVVGLDQPETAICCFPAETGFVLESALRIRHGLDQAASLSGAPPGDLSGLRLLFSAHGLPKRVVARGDPYQWQVERSAAAIVAALDRPGLDHALCYQSRVGRLEWIGPETTAEIERAGRDGKSVVLYPVAFVSEHSETLVELDIEYRRLAEKSGVPVYVRVPTADVGAAFIKGLARLVETAIDRPAGHIGCNGEDRLCPKGLSGCPVRTAA